MLGTAALIALAGLVGRGFAPQPAPAEPEGIVTTSPAEPPGSSEGSSPRQPVGDRAPPAANDSAVADDPAVGEAAEDDRSDAGGQSVAGEDSASEDGEDDELEDDELEDEEDPWAPDPATAARLRGRILGFGERQPLGDARLVFKDGRPSVLAERDGSFMVMLPPGRHEMIVRAPGYRDLPAAVELQPRQDLEVELRLDSDLDSDVYRTVVETERQVAVSSTTLRDDEIHKLAGSRGDPLRVVNSLPGVGQLAGFLPYVVVRGAAPGNTGYYLDGTRVPILFHVAIGPSVIHPYFIDSVDFYPSGAPVRLGRYTSGIIEARTVPARRDRVHGDVDVRLTDAGGLLEIPFDRRKQPGCTEPSRAEKKAAGLRGPQCARGPARGALTMAGRYSYTGGVLSLVNDTVRIAFWDYQLRLDHSLGRNLDITSFAYGSYDDLGTKARTDEFGEEIPEQTFLRAQFHRIDNRLRQRLRGGGSAVYAVVLGLDQTGVVQGIGNDQWRVAPRADFVVPVSDAAAIGFGLDQEIQMFRLPKLEPEDITEDLGLLLSERTVVVTAGYLELMWKKAGFELRPGLRTDFYLQSGNSPYLPRARGVTYATGVDPRLLMRERVGPRLVLKQAVGAYHQPPSFPIPIPGIENFGFERGLQRNIQGSFGYELDLFDDRLRLQQEAYLGRLTNLQDYELAAASEEEPLDELEDIINQVTGWAYGLETLLKLDPRLRTFGWIAYTLSRSTRDFPVGGSAPSNWDQRHILNLVLGYKISQKWYFSGRMHYHTGRPWTAPVGDQSDVDALRDNRNNARLPPFFQLDLRIERIWRWPDWQLHAVLDVANSTYSSEVFLCTPDRGDGGESVIPADFLRQQGNAMFRAAAASGIAKCTAQGFRYVIPSVGLRARW
ncbi:TonB-dependent receptor plug domain-containing protein [Paraliomyxa miuraensis]|uniref:TonB-dependent receptor plug domain-containing protein n=1 Tax=Paraliomyxa miuraensis TaxID=376150 RepID=UPI00225AE93C|nr:TonB-dependent receptor [Paraliomyxa miuraensis]MCX4240504.1 TonB-dependent receptor plug domain-containing protein [Paraliomyxa miuraensis]